MEVEFTEITGPIHEIGDINYVSNLEENGLVIANIYTHEETTLPVVEYCTGKHAGRIFFLSGLDLIASIEEFMRSSEVLE